MLRIVLGAWTLICALSFWVVLPAAADEDATKIKDGIEWYLDSALAGYPGVELRRSVEVTPIEGEYEVAIKALTIAERDIPEGETADNFLLGDVFVRVKPLENGDYRFHSVRIPEEIRVENPEDSADSLVLRIGLEKFEGVMARSVGYLWDYDFLASNFSMTLNSAMPGAASGSVESVAVRIAEVTSTSDFQQPKENAVDQQMVFNLSEFSADFGGGSVLRIGKGTTEFDLSANDVAAMTQAQESLNSYGQGFAESAEQDLMPFMRTGLEFFEAITKFVERANFENLTYDSPDAKGGVEEARFGWEIQDLDKDLSVQELLISTRGFFVSLPTDPAMDAALKMLPRRWTLPVRLERFPAKAIMEDTRALLDDISSPKELDQGGPRVDGYHEKIKQRINEAGTILLLNGQSIESDIVTATMDGTLRINPDNPIGVEGTLTAQALGLMQLFEQAQTIPDPQAAQQVMQGAMVLLSTGETEPGTQVPSVTNYLIEFTPDGAIILNGNQMHPPPAPAQ
ncbi:hypothetical protein [Pelagibius sp. Alg239-R121]|uniref:hypothetical protein n=1 Tax=Pelagibius sp. Alg239-R121 TaxID=2993448 RepID=UPI0024A6FBC0|nr:hypothetical protein [Pelagibius sp. Alg239-R121]